LTTTDPTTGLPEVPEGYFWEIKHALTDGMYRLELRKKYFWVFSERVAFGMMDYPLSDSRIRSKGLSVFDDWKRDQSRAAFRDQSNSYVGKYPPKNLKDVSNDN